MKRDWRDRVEREYADPEEYLLIRTGLPRRVP